MRSYRIGIISFSIVVLFTWGCEHAGPLEAIDLDGGDGTVTFNQIQTAILDNNCAVSGCHIGGGAPLGLDLTAGASYANMVDVASAQVPAVPRVMPGKPDSSYVVWKIEGDPRISGVRMPRGRDPLSQSQIDAIRKWIADGAKDD